MHLPSYAKPVSEESHQIRLLLVGAPGSGKTYTTLSTFPNPLCIDADRGLQNKDIKKLNPNSIPFYDKSVRKAMAPGKFRESPNFGNMADQLTTFLTVEGPKFSADQTLIFDSGSSIADNVSKDLWATCPVTKEREPDGFKYWESWAIWWTGFCDKLKELQCHVVLTMHEEEIRDRQTGRILKYDWILPGKMFSFRMPQFFTDVFRQVANTKETVAGSGKYDREFLWQVLPDDKFSAKTRMNTDRKFVPATYKSFDQYKA